MSAAPRLKVGVYLGKVSSSSSSAGVGGVGEEDKRSARKGWPTFECVLQKKSKLHSPG